MRQRRYYVYIISSKSRRLYTGVTGNLPRRVAEHKGGALSGFARRYKIRGLVYWEEFGEVREALEREKQIKRWRREKKVALIEGVNPGWKDVAEGWFGEWRSEGL